jgi:hypothetical protein
MIQTNMQIGKVITSHRTKKGEGEEEKTIIHCWRKPDQATDAAGKTAGAVMPEGSEEMVKD